MATKCLPQREIDRIFRGAKERVHDYTTFLSKLRANDVVLSVHPPLFDFLSVNTMRRWARLRNFGHALLDCVMLRGNPHRGTYMHAEWVLGWLKKDRLLKQVFDGVPGKRRNLFFSDAFLRYLREHENEAGSFEESCIRFLSSSDERLGPGINRGKLESSQAHGDLVLTASLKRIEGGFVPVMKLFGGHANRPVIWGHAASSFSGEDLVPYLVRSIIAGQPVCLPDMSVLNRVKLTPRFLLRPERYFCRTNPGPCITYTVGAVYIALRAAAEEKPFLESDLRRLMEVSNQLRTPLPRNSFYRFFKASFSNAYVV